LDEDVNQKLLSWKIPQNKFTQNHPITLRRLLSHSAGLSMHGVPEFSPDEQLPTLVQIIEGTWAGAKDSVYSVIEPGKEYRYSGGGYIVLQLLLTDITGNDFAPLAREIVLKPAGMYSSTFEQPLPQELHARAAVGHDNDGSHIKGDWHTFPEQAAAGLWTTPTDLARFAIEIWRSYHGQSDSLLTQHLAQIMLTRELGEMGLGLALPTAGVPRFFHGGANAGYRCFLVLSIQSADGVVIMTNSDSGEKLIDEVFKAIGFAYGWKV
jgi:CubicO group peptidase (beta-lactamase class C family)